MIIGAFQSFQNGKSQNYLPPWWMIIVAFLVILEGKISKFSPVMVNDCIQVCDEEFNEMFLDFGEYVIYITFP